MRCSVAAVALAFVSVFVLSLGTDQALHVLEVYPPWGQPMYDTGLCLLALSYRIVYGVLGGYIAARLAPRNPMRHALALGAIGVVLSGAGGVTMKEFGPLWYPAAIVLSALPCAWLGGALYHREARRARGRSPVDSVPRRSSI
jgi:hypothetical protein